jgi:hypothetical protein
MSTFVLDDKRNEDLFSSEDLLRDRCAPILATAFLARVASLKHCAITQRSPDPAMSQR